MDDVTKMQTEPGGAPLQVIIGGMQQYSIVSKLVAT